MSRHVRTVASLASNAMAGPSRHTVVRPLFHPHAHVARRTLFGDFLPGWMLSRRDQKDKELSAKVRHQTEEANDRAPQAKGESVASSSGSQTGTSIYDGLVEEGSSDAPTDLGKTAEPSGAIFPRKKHTEHWYTSARHKISSKKLRLLAHQIKGLPIDEAILQMQFSVKAAARWIKPNLALAKQHAIFYKGLKAERLIVSEAMVNKDEFGPEMIDIKGRGRFGIKRHPYCRLKFVLREGQTQEEKVSIRFNKEVNRRARSAGNVREWTTLTRKTNSGWAW